MRNIYMEQLEVDWQIIAVSERCEKCTDDVAAGSELAFYTTGLAQYNKGLELELNLPIDPKAAMNILNVIGIALKYNGFTITDGLIDNTLFTAPLLFKKISPGIDTPDKEIMRVVLCDENKRFPDDPECDEKYCKQMRIFRRY